MLSPVLILNWLTGQTVGDLSLCPVFLKSTHFFFSSSLNFDAVLLKSSSPPLPLSPLQQLRANVREMEKLCARVRAEDAAALEVLVRPIRDRALAAVQDFLLLHSRPVSQPPSPPPPAPAPASSCAPSRDDAEEEEPASVRQSQLQLPEIPADQSAAESWDNLEEASMTLPGVKATLLLHHLDLSIAFNI